MIYLIGFHVPWLIAALASGFAMGWMAHAQRTASSCRWLLWAAALGAIAVLLSVANLVPGRIGYWLDLAILMTGAYAIGCYIGSWLRLIVAPVPQEMPPAA